jgi:hypothetical protein
MTDDGTTALQGAASCITHSCLSDQNRAYSEKPLRVVRNSLSIPPSPLLLSLLTTIVTDATCRSIAHLFFKEVVPRARCLGVVAGVTRTVEQSLGQNVAWCGDGAGQSACACRCI